jgi:hypothetical protein
VPYGHRHRAGLFGERAELDDPATIGAPDRSGGSAGGGGKTRWLVGLAVVVAGCASGRSTGAPTAVTVPGPAREAVTRWLGHLATHDDAAAFADLAPRSQAAVGDLGNYQRGSGQFGAVYSNFATPDTRTQVLQVTADLAVVTLRRAGDPAPASMGVPVRDVSGRWLVDPILDTGSYSFLPDDGATVEPRPTITVKLDDSAARARVWVDGSEANAATPTSFRPQVPL